MLDYKTIMAVDLGPLHTAMGAWGSLPKAIDGVGTQYERTVRHGLANSNWKGEAADAALDKIDLVATQFTASSGEAKDIHGLLSDAYESFHAAQQRLKSITHEVNEDKYLSIKADGEVWFDPPADTPADQYGAMHKGYLESIEAYRQEIQKWVTAADTADTNLAWALNQDSNGRARGFDANSAGNLKDAAKGREQAAKDEAALLKLANSRNDLSVDQLKQVNSLLSKHEGDPYFARKFALDMGPKGTLTFWSNIADRVQTGDERSKVSAQIQKSLGTTLSLATQSQDGAMDAWKKQMIGLGDDRVDMRDPKTGYPTKGAYGYQVMSSLMHYGTYDRKFLDDYGKSLIGFEKAHKGTDPRDLWRPDDYETYLNFGGPNNDSGLDPMAGYMDALGHNPEAAKDLFYSKDWDDHNKVDPDLKYLLNDRKWPDGNPFAKDKGGYGYSEFGHALEAATLGTPYGQPELGLHRDAMTANVMEQVIKQVGTDQSFVVNHPGLGVSLGRMSAGYVDDLDWSISDFGTGDNQRPMRDAAFNHTGDGHLYLGQDSTVGFLNAVGRDEDGYKILSAAQQDFTISGLKAYPTPDDHLQRVMETGAKMHGLLDQARTSQIDKDFGDQADQANQQMAKVGEWKKFGIGQSIGLGVGIATLPLEGAALPVAAAFALPSLIEGGGGAVETAQGNAIDQALLDQQIDFDEKDEAAKAKFLQDSQQSARLPLNVYLAAHPELRNSHWGQESMVSNLQNWYGAGSDLGDQRDAD